MKKNTFTTVLRSALLLSILFWSAPLSLPAQEPTPELGEIILFAPQHVANERVGLGAEIYSAKWTDATGILPDDVYCTGKNYGEDLFVKNPKGANVKARRFKAITNDCDGMAEVNAFSVAFDKNHESYKNSVFPYAVFGTKAERDAFINNHAGALDWASISTDNVPNWFSHSPHHQKYSFRGMFPQHPALSMSWGAHTCEFIVMEEQRYVKNAIVIDTRMVHPITLGYSNNSTQDPYFKTPLTPGYNEARDKFANLIEVTYTNTAPYPVLFAAYEPKVNASRSTYGYEKEAATLLMSEYAGIYDGTPEDGDYTYAFSDEKGRRFMPITLLPHQSRKLTWEINFFSKFHNLGFISPRLIETNRLLHFDVEVANYTTTPQVLIQTSVGAEVIKAQGSSVLPGTANDKMAVLGYHPSQFNTDSAKILTLEMHQAQLMGKIEFDNNSQITTINPSHINREGGLIKLNLQPYIGSTKGTYALNIFDNEGVMRKKVYIYANPNVGVTPQSLYERQFVITQTADGKFKQYGYCNDGKFNNETVLLDIATPRAERDPKTNIWTLQPQVIINTLLASDGKGYFTLKITPEEVLLEPHDGAALYHTGAYMQYENNNADGLGTCLTPKDGNYRIRLTSNKIYNNAAPPVTDGEKQEYPDQWIAPTIETGSAFDVNLFGESPLAKMENPILYRDEISLKGSLNVASLLPYDILKNFLDVDLQVHDLRLGHKNKLRGARGNFSGFVGINDPLGLVTAGGMMDVKWNNLPENLNKKVSASGAIELSSVGGVSGEVVCKPTYVESSTGKELLGNTYWFVDEIYAELNAPIPFPPCPVIQISALGAGVSGIASNIRMATDIEQGLKSKESIPSFYLQGTLGLGIVDDDLIGIKGTANLGTTMGLTKGEFSLFTIKLLTDLTLTSQFRTSPNYMAKDFYITAAGKEVPIPLAMYQIDMGGKLNLLNILKGEIDGHLRVNMGALPSRFLSPGATTKDIQQRINELVNTIAAGGFNEPIEVYIDGFRHRMLLKDLLWELIDFRLNGDVGIYVPENLPLGGQRLAGATGYINKENAMGTVGAEVKLEFTFKGETYKIGKKISFSIIYYFKTKKTDANLSFKAPRIDMAGTPQYGRRFVMNDIENGSFEFSSPQLVPMTKDSEARAPSISIAPLAWSEQWSNAQTQTIEDVSKGFTIAVRSKSNNTGLKLSCASGDLEGLVANYSAADIEWKLSEEDDSYYHSTIAFDLPDELIHLSPAGSWTVEAYDANVLTADEAGQIDCDFFYLITPATINNVSYNADNVAWNHADLVSSDRYRVRLDLVNQADTTIVYPMGTTPEWLGSEPLNAYALPIDTLARMNNVVSGNYRLRATLEKYDGCYTLNDTAAEDDTYHDLWLEQNAAQSNTFAHTNAWQPTTGVTNYYFQMSANGTQTLGWDALTDMTNVDGIHAHVKDSTGATVVTYLLPKDATEITIAGAATPATEGVTKSQVLFDTKYNLEVVPYHQFNNVVANLDDALTADTLITTLDGTDPAKVSIPMLIRTPLRPAIYQLCRGVTDNKTEHLLAGQQAFDGITMEPGELADLDISLRSDHWLTLTIPDFNAYFNEAQVSISEEMGLFAKNNPGGGTPSYTDITAKADVKFNDRVEIPFADYPTGAYLLECKLYNGGDYNAYRFRIHIDNTPPMLIVGTKMQTEEGTWVVSGVSERDLELFTFNGDTITLSNGTFAQIVEDNIASISVSATDRAGNIAVLHTQLADIPQMPDGDTTAAVKVDSTLTQVKVGTTATATAKLLRGETYITIPAQDAHLLKWSVVKGNEVLTIHPDNGTITAQAAGQAIIRAGYAEALFDVAMITVAEEFPVADLYVSHLLNADKTSLRLSFTEPAGATDKWIEASTDTPVEGEVNTGWARMAATFDGAGHATLTLPDADSTYYFRLCVADGFNQGTSNVAGKKGNTSFAAPTVYTLTISDQGTDATGEGTYAEGEIVLLTAGTPPSGKFFKNWAATPAVAFANANAESTTFAMPAADVTVTIEYTSTTDVATLPQTTGLQVETITGGLLISGLSPGDVYTVCNTQGQVLCQGQASNAKATVSLREPGVYLVSVGNKVLRAVY